MGKLHKYNMGSTCSPIEVKPLDKCPEVKQLTRTERRKQERRQLKELKRSLKNKS